MSITYPKSYQKYATMYPNREVIHAMLWDTLLYTSAATLALRFFATIPATIDIGNMTIAGQLPYPRAFLIRAIRCFFKHRPFSQDPAAAASAAVGTLNDVTLLANTCELSITIGSKNYGHYPLRLFSAGGGAWGVIGLADVGPAGAPNIGSIQYGQLGRMHVEDVYTLSKPLFIEPQMDFHVDLAWAAAVTLSGNVNVCIALEGDEIRPVQ